MYICLCNALTEQDLRRAVDKGVRRPSEVYESCGARAQCGSCAGAVLCVLRRFVLERSHETGTPAPAAAM